MAVISYFVVDFIFPDNTVLQNVTESLGWTSSICLASYTMFNKYLWKIWPIKQFVKRPNINGIWIGNINFEYNNKPGKKKTTVKIEQTFYDIKICLKTDINISKSCMAEYCSEDSKIFYVYKTDPHSKTKDENPIQYGAAQIIIDLNNLNKLRIEYWTDRQTKGYIDLKRAKNQKQRS